MILSACWNFDGTDSMPVPPIAKKVPHAMTLHGEERIDDYYWIRDDQRSDPEMLALLKAENEYTNKVLAHTKELQTKIFEEITHRLTTNDSTVPVTMNGYDYHQEYRLGGEYPIYLRRRLDEQEATIILDVNELAAGQNYYQVGNWVVSPKTNILAYAADNQSRRIYQIRFKNLETGELLPDVIENAHTNIAWANDNKTIFYIEKDKTTLLPYRVKRHQLGTPTSSDVTVYEELDPAFYLSVYTTRSESFVVITSSSTDSTEIRLIDAGEPESEAVLLLAREENHEYRIRHIKGTFYILTNWEAENFRLMSVKDNDLGDKTKWREVISHQDAVLLQDIEIFEDYLVLDERTKGLPRIRIIRLDDQTSHLIEFPDKSYHARLHSNPEVKTRKLRYVYSSLIQPETVYEYDMESQQSSVLKQDEVVGGFDRTLYQSDRVNIKGRDGTLVPVSLVYRKDQFQQGSNPLYLHGYGAYGYSTEPTFNAKRLSLIDRGFIYAMVHVRGGEDLGRHWYEDGRLLNKRNTFWDFIDATHGLVEMGYGDKRKVFAQGGSAGGLLMGVIANEAPDSYLGIIAHVPFVDVITTMLDESIPLTAGEFREWGNPKDKKAYDYMLSYSPYDQVKAQNYPNMYVTTGLFDSQVQYFEPVKWVSKLRSLKLDDNYLLLDIDMKSGHGGASGRYDRYQIDAREYAFVLDLLENL